MPAENLFSILIKKGNRTKVFKVGSYLTKETKK